MFRAKYPVAWAFHRNTVLSRYLPGGLAPAEVLTPFKEDAAASLVALPAPGRLRASLGMAIQRRLSCRQFQDGSLPLPVLSTLLHAAYGIQERAQFGEHELLIRPVPSGGGLYPLEVYLLARRVQGIEPGIYHYAVLDHALEPLERHPLPAERLTELFLGQSYVADAAVILVLTAVLARSLGKYADRGYRLVLLEAGHVAQNLNLGATALGWASLNLGGFFDLELAADLHLDPEVEVPIYAMAVGRPGATDAGSLRDL